MIYLNGNTKLNNSYYANQQCNGQQKTLIKQNNAMESDTVSFSGSASKNDKAQHKSHSSAYLLGGLALVAGIAFVVIKFRKGKGGSGIGDLEKDINKSVKNIEDNTADNIGKETTELNNESVKIAEVNKELVNEEKNADEIKEQIKSTENQSDIIQHNETPAVSSINNIKTKGEAIVEPIKESETLDEALNRGYDLYAEQLAKGPELLDKKALIREVTPELLNLPKTIIKDDNDKKIILKMVTAENKDFIFKEAIPTALRNAEKLDINNMSDMKSLLEIVTPDNVDCLDKLAENTQLFKIQSNIDTFNLLKGITKENKDFVFSDVLPQLIKNADTYKITRGGQMRGFIETITPENKDFMFNESIPMIIKNYDKLDLDASEISKVANLTTKNNLKNVQIIADNINQFDIKDDLGFLDFDKLAAYLQK